MDDVDFTVLAATSVLDDLIVKCPPAEACRDAFDRMAKATIAMAMKETGFGQDALRFLPPKEPRNTASSTPMSQRSQEEVNFLDPNLRHQPSHKQRRPPPRFDMDLKDLFSDDEFHTRSSMARRANMHSLGASTVKREHTRMHQPATSIPLPSISTQHGYRQQQASPHLYRPGSPIDPTLQHMPGRTPGGSPNQHPHQQQQQASYFAGAQHPYSQQSPAAGAYSENPLDSLDFLDSFHPGGLDDGHLHLPTGASGPEGYAEYDLGFGVGGLAFDGGAGQSWDEHGGFDLFDGFFFGGGAAGGGHGS